MAKTERFYLSKSKLNYKGIFLTLKVSRNFLLRYQRCLFCFILVTTFLLILSFQI